MKRIIGAVAHKQPLGIHIFRKRVSITDVDLKGSVLYNCQTRSVTESFALIHERNWLGMDKFVR